MTHRKIHNGEWPCTDTQFEKTFEESFLLNKHDYNNIIKKPLVCFNCDKTFKHRSPMKDEMTHTVEKPFECQKCDQTFEESCDLKKPD